MPPKDHQFLMEALGYPFKNPELLKTALTHRSLVQDHNERLEFLGDAVLALCVGSALFHQFPLANEGQLSRMRANVVKGDSLVRLAQVLNLGDYLLLGQGERKTGGQRRSSILEDAMEALIGALYLDGGLAVAETYILKWFGEKLSSLEVQGIDAKSELQEYLQHYGHSTPDYVLIRTEGLAHEQEFFVKCEVKDLGILGEGQAKNRKAAEQKAAAEVLKELKLKRIPR